MHRLFDWDKVLSKRVCRQFRWRVSNGLRKWSVEKERGGSSLTSSSKKWSFSLSWLKSSCISKTRMSLWVASLFVVFFRVLIIVSSICGHVTHFGLVRVRSTMRQFCQFTPWIFLTFSQLLNLRMVNQDPKKPKNVQFVEKSLFSNL